MRSNDSKKRGEPQPEVILCDQDGTGLNLHPLTGWPWVLQQGRKYWMHRVGEASYGPQFMYCELMPRVHRRLNDYVPRKERTRRGLASGWIGDVDRVVLSYSAALTTYDPESRTLTLAAEGDE